MKVRLLALLIVFGCALPQAHAQELSSQDLYKKVLPSIMTLKVETADGKEGIGTGFLTIKDGLAVTAWHVVKGAKHVVAKFSSDEEFDVSGLVDKDEKRDVALIRVKVAGRPLLTLKKDDPDVASRVYVIGAPSGLEFTITDGLISQIRTLEGVKQFQFSCPASPGNSGGPLINTKGEVLGVVSWQVRDKQNLSFAIPAIYVLGLDPTLPTQPWDKVKVDTPIHDEGALSEADMDKLLGKSFCLIMDTEETILEINYYIVTRPGGYSEGVPASLYVLQHNIEQVLPILQKTASADSDREHLRSQMADTLSSDGNVILLLIAALRTAQAEQGWDSESKDLLSRCSATIALTPLPDPGPLSKVAKTKEFQEFCPEEQRIEVGLLSDPIGFDFGVQTAVDAPLLLVRVRKNSFAETIGLKPFDQIVAIEDHEVSSLSEFKKALKNAFGTTVTVRVRRNGRLKNFKVNLPSEPPK